MLRLTNCRLCDHGRLVSRDLYIDQATGTIVPKPPKSVHVQTVDLGGAIVAPGYIDIQNNGIYGLNFLALNSESSPAEVAQFKAFYRDCMAKYLATGVTSLCPTVTSNFPSVYRKVLPVYKRTRSRAMADSLGAHVEGPFINKAKKGCHPAETFVDGHTNSFAAIYGAENLRSNVTIVTAAPEIPGVMAEIPRLLDHPNIVFSIGHTTLDLATCRQAVASGALMVTHLYNAMPQPHHRDAGVVGLVTDPQTKGNTPFFGLICDGVHVAPSMCVFAYRANPDKCVLVTDAMHLIGLADGTYQWDKQRIVKSGASLYLEGTTTLAGAATNLADCVKNLAKWADITLAQAVKTVTNNAADSLGICHKGYLEDGCDADLVILNDAGDVLQVYKLGTPLSVSSGLTAQL
ncbi:Metallo-dependent hydrolase [Metschnikowia bicuspidata var. bicuspidata NRRL YB-4993]|uniref:N-acetylglucosamine-6-phosphate deacetylase n=1 Tax=Metschnikowia bicuspidata var. bicuspidata NRRL YB-4993 TaxID=869754 RepID=A0A1A0H9H4_9ASCO|nr:Metallo-dependent hydrolase [Metschnikowia bicuspidata var. bicuspidata NRRL YB-4993]OBA20774.1 Metallo-dependent hydrolase [Metschnikowia bicuspidata var. bicuspidata NRRL YB-4993]